MKRSNSLKETKCTACDAEAFARFEGVPYCKKHYMQMYHKVRLPQEQSMTLMSTFYMMTMLNALLMIRKAMRQQELK